MSANVPDLDTVDFDRLVETARGLIPRYAPGWTDHNLHDPGMTILDLLAWIVDQQVYRVGAVGDRLLEAFAALLGQRRQAPQPARGLVWPVGRPGPALLVEGTTVTCLPRRDLPFELDRTLLLTPAGLTGMAVGAARTPGPFLLPQPQRPILVDPAGEDDAWLHLLFDGPLVPPGFRPADGTVAPVAIGFDVAVAGNPLPGSGQPPLRFQHRLGAGRWADVATVADTTGSLARSGVIVMAIPAPEGPDRPPAALRAHLDPGLFPAPVAVRAVALNVLPIRQVGTTAPYGLGDASGQPDQEVELATADLVPQGGAAALSVTIGGQAWEATPDLSRSGPHERHYERGSNGLRFGNGVNGRIPPAGATIMVGSLHRTRGAAGDLRAGLDWALPALTGEQVYGRNRRALTGGADPTSLDDLLVAARRAAADRRAALSNADLQRLAFAVPGVAVARAEVVSGYDHRLPGRRVPGARTLVVVPPPRPGAPATAAQQFGPGRLWPFLAAVRAGLEPHRVLGERLRVTAPELVGIDVAVRLTVEPGALTGAVADLVEDRIRCRLSATRRAGDIEPWPLGRTVAVEEVEQLVVTTPGVSAIVGCSLAVAGGTAADAAVPVPPIGVAVAREVQVTAVAATDPATREGWR